MAFGDRDHFRMISESWWLACFQSNTQLQSVTTMRRLATAALLVAIQMAFGAISHLVSDYWGFKMIYRLWTIIYFAQIFLCVRFLKTDLLKQEVKHYTLLNIILNLGHLSYILLNTSLLSITFKPSKLILADRKLFLTSSKFLGLKSILRLYLVNLVY